MKQLSKSDEAMEPVMDDLLEKIRQGVPLIAAKPTETTMPSAASDRKTKKRYCLLFWASVLSISRTCNTASPVLHTLALVPYCGIQSNS